MKKTFFKYGIMAAMMAFALTFCYSCSKDEEENPNAENIHDNGFVPPDPENPDFHYNVTLKGAGYNFSHDISYLEFSQIRSSAEENSSIDVGDTLNITFWPNRPASYSVSCNYDGAFEWIKETDQLVALKPAGGPGYELIRITIHVTAPNGGSGSTDFVLFEIFER